MSIHEQSSKGDLSKYPQELLRSQINDQTGSGFTPLHDAIVSKPQPNVNNVKTLLACPELKINLQDGHGRTPLHHGNFNTPSFLTFSCRNWK
jgi:hypothetical protein